MGARRVVITRGDHGLISVSDEQSLRVGAYPVDFVDGSGGGDAFNAGYIVGLLEDRSELDCLKLASAVGASCVRAVGTTAGVFDRSEAEEFLRRHELAVETLA
jgi:sugar/nucleoside kinase (ribokinase family)